MFANKVQEFDYKKAVSYLCGKNSVKDYLHSTKVIKDAFDRPLYKSKGTIKTVVEKAVKDDVDLYRANLQGASLNEANLTKAKLEGAKLEGADLEVADLIGTNLKGANLKEASLKCANLTKAKLEGANLKEASLEGANLDGANLDGVDLTKIKNYEKIIGTIKNLDKAEYVDPKVLADWQKAQTNDIAMTKAVADKSR